MKAVYGSCTWFRIKCLLVIQRAAHFGFGRLLQIYWEIQNTPSVWTFTCRDTVSQTMLTARLSRLNGQNTQSQGLERVPRALLRGCPLLLKGCHRDPGMTRLNAENKFPFGDLKWFLTYWTLESSLTKPKHYLSYKVRLFELVTSSEKRHKLSNTPRIKTPTLYPHYFKAAT